MILKPQIEVNDEVSQIGQTGHFVVLRVEGMKAEVQLFGDDIHTGERFYFEPTENVPVSLLSVLRKNHQKPVRFRLVRIGL